MCKTNAQYKKKNKKNKKRNQHGICKRNSPDKKRKKSMHWMCKRNSQNRNQDSTGCVRETPRINIKAARDV